MKGLPWYAHDIAKYESDTSHLGLLEHGAYRLLLDHYYKTAKPLPTKVEHLHRICRAFANHEKTAISEVLAQFFHLEGDGWHNNAADRELRKMGQISEKRRNAAKGIRTPVLQEPDNCETNDDTLTLTPTKPSNKILNGHSEQFEDFWSAYPRREGRGGAIKAYLKALEKTSPEMLTGCAGAYASKMAGKEKQYIKMAATWLNQDCWTDDGIAPQTALTQDQLAINIDRADRLMNRGKYAVKYE